MSIRRRRHTPRQGSPRRSGQTARGNVFSRVGGAIARLLLRLLFVLPRRLAQPSAQSGFILPTVVLLLLVVTLTVGSISLRTFTRTTQAIGDRQQQVIYNAATPAIDRAKAKLEYLFSQDDRLPSGTPGETFLVGMMANDGQPRGTLTVEPFTPTLEDGVTQVSPYEFEDETRIDLDGNPATNDNAWQFPVDTDGVDGPDTVIAYSLVFQTPNDINDLSDRTDVAVANRAESLQVKNGPLSSTAASSNACANRTAGAVEEGWFKVAGTNPSKNFQVNAIAIPGAVNIDGTLETASAIATIATLEFQQDRQVEQGNKWGAWFRNDLEVFPGPQFRWNGAMHTEGNLIVGQGNRGDGSRPFRAFLISSTNSCLNTSKSDSEITLGEPELADNGGIAFQGQVINGRVVDADFAQTSLVHIFGEENPRVNPPELNEETDSLANDAPDKADFALDPIRLLAEGVSVSRNVEDAGAFRNPAWDTDDATPEIEERILSRSEDQPLVGDSYRADNREGPQPRYSGVEVTAVGSPTADLQLINPGLTGDTNVGLDGYWERRARNEGMRIVVGQRLELGDPYGWTPTGPTAEPLYPFEQCTPTSNLGCHETRQRRTLADNLAAVQATAIYHATSAGGDGDLPRVCLATTVHPGTAKTLQDSATFEALQIIEPRSAIVSQAILTDFFTGRGTNGWEFDFPYGANFATVVGSVEPLGIALRNLAQFAGDPNGGAPSFTPIQDDVVHPYPLMSMWGDFSVLRNVTALLDGGTTYAALSPADKTTLHTATCTLGMLAYNIDYLNRFNPVGADASPLLVNTEYGDGGSVEDGAITTLATRLSALTAVNPTGVTLAAGDPAEAFITVLEQWNGLDSDAATGVTNNMLAIARVIANKEQVNRDRLNGFAAGPSTYACTPYVNASMEMLCADGPKYPVLRALFPPGDITALAETADETRDGAVDAYISAQNGGLFYQRTTPVAAGSPTADLLNNVDTVAIAPQESLRSGWVTPIAAGPFEAAAPDVAPVNPNSNEQALIRCIDEACGVGSLGSETWPVPFKDAAPYDGRERMSVRTLDIDLDLLREASFFADPNEQWLPLSGIVFAFREDAVREDAIVRPAAAGAPLCADYLTLEGNPATCQTHADGSALTASTDPLLLDKGFSMKAVDFVSDPDRRSYGFRLTNGATLKRTGDLGRGVSFIADNSVYIRGAFNLHRGPTVDDPGVIEQLEEFTQRLNPTWDNFYTRTTPDNRFANPRNDDWRPTEVLADAVIILSSDFCDGSVEDGFLTAGENNTVTLGADAMGRYGCAGDHTSYLNQNRPRTNPGDWRRQNSFDSESPIFINRNGNPVDAADTPYTGNYFAQEENGITPAAEQIVNLSVISGIVPSRLNQPYGGLHNFPRFIEDWDDVDLSMSGTFYQLNFSAAATAPFDQEVWEPEAVPTDPRDRFPYYNPPNRLWGYDVALQYVPAAPIASRFASTTPARSEFYSEPTLDDPYIAQLCRQVAGNDSFCPPE